MSLIAIENLTKSFGGRTIFKNISLEADQKDHIGLVGANGAGKSTLFRLITGEELADEGAVVRSKELKLGIMEQFLCRDENATPYSMALGIFERLIEQEKLLKQIEGDIEKGNVTDELLERQQLVRESFEADGGLYFRSLSRSALMGLGFTEEELNRPIHTLSGGQRSKISLACLLISGANFLLLDEPTNHLDIHAVEWLEEYLKNFKGGYIVVSHDRYFLDRVTNRTAEIEHEKLCAFKGNYTDYLAEKKKNREIEQKHFDNQMKEINRLKETVTELKRWNKEKSVKRAESKEKVIEKLEKELEAPEKEIGTVKFTFSASSECPFDVLTAENLGMSFDRKVIYKNVNLEIHKNERVFLLGANGCGKTTLLKQITGRYNGEGRINFGIGVRFAYYDQAQESLNDKNTVLEEVWKSSPALSQTAVRNALAAFLFKGDDVFKKIETLSGGERARVAIVKIMLSGANFLILDEPTNHLDIGSREALEDAIEGFNGTVLMVTHDRYLINRLSHRIYYLKENGVSEFKGGYDAYTEKFRMDNLPEKAEKKQTGSGGEQYKKRKERESLLRKLKGGIARLEKESEDIAEEISRVQSEIETCGSDYEKILELTSALDSLKEREESTLAVWEEQCERLSELENQETAE